MVTTKKGDLVYLSVTNDYEGACFTNTSEGDVVYLSVTIDYEGACFTNTSEGDLVYLSVTIDYEGACFTNTYIKVMLSFPILRERKGGERGSLPWPCSDFRQHC
jgi:hypothetical protein